MKPAIDQQRIINYLQKPEVQEWIESKCSTLSDYSQFCIDFADRVCGHGHGFRATFESKLYIHKADRFEYHFHLNTQLGYMEVTRYCSLGTKTIKSRCPIDFVGAYATMPQIDRVHGVGYYGRV